MLGEHCRGNPVSGGHPPFGCVKGLGWSCSWMGFVRQLLWLLVLVIGSSHVPIAYGDICNPNVPTRTWVPIVSSSCEKRHTGNGTCLENGDTFKDTNFEHRGSELNNGNLVVTASNEECCELCRETPGCKIWTRFKMDLKYNAEGTCWIKSSAPPTPSSSIPFSKREGMDGGLIDPPVENPAPCNVQRGVGISNVVAYNNPDLLHTEQWETCCLWCQVDDQFCTAWMWSSATGKCRLFGNVVDESNKRLCRDCMSGTRTASRDSVKKAALCESGGEFSVKYLGSDRVILAPAGSFTTNSSQECCGLCDAIKDCRSWSWRKSQECILNADVPQATWDSEYFGGIARNKVCNPVECDDAEGVYMEGKELYCSQYAAPSDTYLVLGSKEDCCMRCQEVPECKAWSYSQGRSFSGHSVCSLKLGIADQGQFISVKGANSGQAWSGIIHSRCNDNEIDNFLERVAAVQVAQVGEEAQTKFEAAGSEGEVGGKSEKNNDPSTVIIASVVAAVFFLCVILLVGFVLREHYRRKAYNAVNMGAQPGSGGSQSSVHRSSTPSGAFVHKGNYHSSSTDTNKQFVEMGISRQSPSSNGRPYAGSSTPVAQSNEMKLQSLKRRIASLKGPDGRFSSSLDHYEDEEWLKLNDAISELQLGTELGGKYVIEAGIHMGDNSIVMNAQQKFNSSSPVVLKFFRHQKYHDIELSLYQQQLEPAYIPQVFDVYDSSTVESWGFPPLPCIVMERGNSTLSEWLQRHLRVLDHMDQRSILFKICKAVQHLHEHEIVHRDLKPENMVIFSDTLSWKLIDFGSWAQKGATAQLEYTLRYAAPELLVAHATEDVIQVMPSTDMWSLGLIFWEVLTGDPLFGEEYDKEEVMAMLVGVKALPFEKHPELWHRIQHYSARRLVVNLLYRNPIKRWNVKKVLQNGYFMSAPDTVQLAEGHQEYANALKVITGAVERVDESVQQVKNIAIENLKQTMGGILIVCFSFYEIDPVEVMNNQQTDSEFAKKYANSNLKMTKALIEPSYNVFKRTKEEPAMLLRLERKHMLKITLMYGSNAALDLPISEIVFARILPSGADGDHQEMEVFMMFHKGHLMEGVGLWNTTNHKHKSLKLFGSTFIDICIGLRMKGSEDIVEVHKTVDLRMHPAEEKFRVVKQFQRSKEWFSNLPPWAKIYIHGAVAVVSLTSKVLL